MELINRADAAATDMGREITLKGATRLLANDAAADWLSLFPNLMITTTEVSRITTNIIRLLLDMAYVATNR